MANRFVRAAIAGLVLASMPALEAQAPAKGTGPVEVTGPIRVVDGDTVDVFIDGHEAAIGLIGIKAPRANSPCGRKAAEFLDQLVNQRDGVEASISLRFEEDAVLTFDARKRRLYYLRLPGGASAAVALVKAGLVTPDGSGDEAGELADAARTAPKCVD